MINLSDLYDIYRRSTGVSTDSRMVTSGSLFFALKGDNFDGNTYAVSALEKGARVVVDAVHVMEAMNREQRSKCFVVDNVLTALQQLAAYHRMELGIPIMAITGSNGKTTTKELLGRVLSSKYRIAATAGNLNNHIGVPLTLLSMGDDVEFGIVEMGANHCGEIEQLCAIARPNYGLITNVGKAHLEGFGGVEGVKKGKGELFNYLQNNGGTAFYLKDSEILCSMVEGRAGLKTAPYTSSDFVCGDSGEYLNVSYGGQDIKTHLVGDYNVYNVAAAFAVGRYCGIDDADIIFGIENYTPDNNRSQRVVTANNVVVMDAYNANPSSMTVALHNFSKDIGSKHKVLIIGDMRELGEYAQAEHRAIVEYLRELSVDQVFLVGSEFSSIPDCIFPSFKDVGLLREYLILHPLVGKFILVKGSRGVSLEKIFDLL